jgi:hypothetical protein
VVFEWQQGPIYTEAEVVEGCLSLWMQVVPGRRAKHWTECEVCEADDRVPPVVHMRNLPPVYWSINS